MSYRVVITGMGVVSPYGIGTDLFWNRLLECKSALKFDSALKFVVGRVPDVKEMQNENFGKEMSRSSKMALIAAEEAFKDSRLECSESWGLKKPMENMGVNVGCGITDLMEIYETGIKIDAEKERKVSPYFVPKILTNVPAWYISQRFNLLGGNCSSTTACATGASSIGDAFMQIRLGRWEKALAGSVESCINKIGLTGFSRLKALANGQNVDISRPFDKSRIGFVLSEGAAILVLERLEDALKRRAKIYAEILGYGMASDAYHLTSPELTGLGSRLSMQRALKDSAMNLSEYVGYLNAHATSTSIGDKIEAFSIASIPELRRATISSIKGNIGHSLAASGALEIVATASQIYRKKILPTLNLVNCDEEFSDLDLLRLKSRDWDDVEKNQRRIALKNSFGFGGVYVSLVLSEFKNLL